MDYGIWIMKRRDWRLVETNGDKEMGKGIRESMFGTRHSVFGYKDWDSGIGVKI